MVWVTWSQSKIGIHDLDMGIPCFTRDTHAMILYEVVYKCGSASNPSTGSLVLALGGTA